MAFREHAMGLYVYDTSAKSLKVNYDNNHNLLNTSYDYLFINTVDSLSSEFTKREIEEAKRARLLYINLGRPSMSKFIRLLSNNNIADCPVRPEHARRAQYVFGPDVAGLKGKTTRRAPAHVDDIVPVPVPAFIREWHNNVTLCIDIFYVNGMPFFHSVSRKLQFRTVEDIPSRAYKHLLLCMQNVQNLYKSRNFVVVCVRGHLEFECLRDALIPVRFDPAAKGDHVPEVERPIRTMKEHFRSCIQGLPYEFYTKIMVKSAILNVCRLLNLLPSDTGVSRDISPVTLVCGTSPPRFSDFNIAFGTYAQVHDNNVKSNTPASRTTGGIALRPISSSGAWAFMSLLSGDQII